MSRSQRIARDVLVSLGAQRSRVLLMMLGLSVGVAVLSAVIVIGQGTRERILGLVERHGLDMVMVRAGGDVQVFAPQSDRGLASLLEGDARAIRRPRGIGVVPVSARDLLGVGGAIGAHHEQVLALVVGEAFAVEAVL